MSALLKVCPRCNEAMDAGTPQEMVAILKAHICPRPIDPGEVAEWWDDLRAQLEVEMVPAPDRYMHPAYARFHS